MSDHEVVQFPNYSHAPTFQDMKVAPTNLVEV